MENENGFEAGARAAGRGVGWYFLAAIPFVLGMGASVWFGVYIGAHNFRKQLSQEQRGAVYVGADPRPKSRLSIQIKAVDCVHITKADIDGRTLMLYASNDCHNSIRYLEWHWQLLSPDGTAIAQGFQNQCPMPNSPGDKAECVFSGPYHGLPDEDRAAIVLVWTGDPFN
jgi:hypothetical protein